MDVHMTTMWATLMIYEAMKNGRISEDAAKYFDGLIGRYSQRVENLSVYDVYTLRYNDTITCNTIEDILDNIFNYYTEEFWNVTICTWTNYISKITYDRAGEVVSLEDLLGLGCRSDKMRDDIYKDLKTIYNDPETTEINVSEYIQCNKVLLKHFEHFGRKNEVRKLIKLLERGERRLEELNKAKGVNPDE